MPASPTRSSRIFRVWRRPIRHICVSCTPNGARFSPTLASRYRAGRSAMPKPIPARVWEVCDLKLVLFQRQSSDDVLPGLMTDRGIIDISSQVQLGYTPQLTMEGIIDNFDQLRPGLERLAAE